MAKHDGQQRIWVDGDAHRVLVELKAASGESLRRLASVAIGQYARRRRRTLPRLTKGAVRDVKWH